MPKIESHKRVNDIFLGPLERPALHWLAVHMPPWVNPDILTTIGVIGTLIIALSYWLCRYNYNFLWLASLGFVINWFGDSLDGTLARYRHIERPKYGFYIDHAVDAFTEVIMILSLGISPYVRFDVACIALIGYLLMSNLVFLRTCVVGEFRLSYGRLGPTEARVIVIMANAIVYFTHNPVVQFRFGTFSLFDFIALGIAFLLYYFAFTTTISQALELARKGE